MQIVHAGGAGHSALAGFLSEQSANVLICGGIGEGAQEALERSRYQSYIRLQQEK